MAEQRDTSAPRSAARKAIAWDAPRELALLKAAHLTFEIPLFVIGLSALLPAWGYFWLTDRRAHRQMREEAQMPISTTIRNYLEDRARPYEVLRHDRTVTSMETAEAAHLPGDQIAKSVLIEDEDGYLIAVIPATHRLLFGALREQFGQHFGLATEREMQTLFEECELGSLPPFGEAFGIRVLVDDALLAETDLYCESGDHSALLHLTGGDFRALMRNASHGRFSAHV